MESDLGVLVDGKMSLSQEHALEVNGALIPWDALCPALSPGQGRGCPLCSVLCSLTSSIGCSLSVTVQEGHKTIRELPKEGYRNGE